MATGAKLKLPLTATTKSVTPIAAGIAVAVAVEFVAVRIGDRIAHGQPIDVLRQRGKVSVAVVPL